MSMEQNWKQNVEREYLTKVLNSKNTEFNRVFSPSVESVKSVKVSKTTWRREMWVKCQFNYQYLINILMFLIHIFWLGTGYGDFRLKLDILSTIVRFTLIVYQYIKAKCVCNLSVMSVNWTPLRYWAPCSNSWFMLHVAYSPGTSLFILLSLFIIIYVFEYLWSTVFWVLVFSILVSRYLLIWESEYSTIHVFWFFRNNV